jgi:fructose-1,6-bisphosphatase/inositol monophosphatase family enzyme
MGVCGVRFTITDWSWWFFRSAFSPGGADSPRPIEVSEDTQYIMIPNLDRLLAQLRTLHFEIRRSIVDQAERFSSETLARVAEDNDQTTDTIFAIDKISEERLVEYFEREVAPERPLILVAEGLHDVGFGRGKLVLPRGHSESEAEVCILMDPLDGTRPYMYQKRSAWILTGVAPSSINHDPAHSPQEGPWPRLRDIECALQTEVPLAKQHLSDELTAVRGQGMHAERYNRLSGLRTSVSLSPSKARDISQGFVTVCRFFPGMGAELIEINEEIIQAALGPAEKGRAACFEDQYISSGGQLYELIAGHDRVTLDLRPLVEPLLQRRGLPLGMCAHPYDLSTLLIAEEAGVIVTDGRGQPLDAPLDAETDVAWVGYANPSIRAKIEPLLQRALIQRGLMI